MNKFKKLLAIMLVLALSITVVPINSTYVSAAPNDIRMTIYSSPNEKNGYHSFLTFENLGDSDFKFSKVLLPKGYGLSVGAWPDKGAGDGIFFHLEAWYMKNQGLYKNRVGFVKYITRAQAADIAQQFSKWDYWKLNSTCTSFAIKCWNHVVSKNDKFNQTILPDNLAKQIKKRKGYVEGNSLPNVRFISTKWLKY